MLPGVRAEYFRAVFYDPFKRMSFFHRTVTVKILCILVVLALPGLAWPAAAATEKADFVRVNKSERMLYLYKEGAIIASFAVALGGQPRGHKQQEGDRRTPEGWYVLDYKKENSAFFRAIHISYPNTEDVARAQRRGVKPGGAIMIHGQENGLESFTAVRQRTDWTDGCIALTNPDMQRVWDAVDAGTPIEIEP